MEMNHTTLHWPRLAPVMTPDADDAGQELRPLDWATLCARLAAAQQLRRAWPGFAMAERGPVSAAFHPSGARVLASAAQLLRGVNLEPLANGKTPAGIRGKPDEPRSAGPSQPDPADPPDFRDRGPQ